MLKLKILWTHFLYGVILSLISKIIDFPISYKIGKFSISLPISHKLPYFVKLFPQYSQNLGRVAKTVKSKYYSLKIIDVGANVGDSAAIIRNYINSEILCIEGSEKYFSYLKRNAGTLKKIDLAECFIGLPDKKAGRFVENRGTGNLKLEGEKGEGSVRTRSLNQILASHPEYINSKLLKIDTDGFDITILKSSESFLSKARPVIFFEYSPYFSSIAGEKSYSVFEYFEQLGYKKVVFYDNFGDYILAVDISNKQILYDLDLYFSQRQSQKYADLCLFHKEDSELFERLRKSELNYYRRLSG